MRPKEYWIEQAFEGTSIAWHGEENKEDHLTHAIEYWAYKKAIEGLEEACKDENHRKIQPWEVLKQLLIQETDQNSE